MIATPIGKGIFLGAISAKAKAREYQKTRLTWYKD